MTRTEFDGAQLDLYLDFSGGARFSCLAKDCTHGACAVHDTADKTWRHMDFFQESKEIRPVRDLDSRSALVPLNGHAAAASSLSTLLELVTADRWDSQGA